MQGSQKLFRRVGLADKGVRTGSSSFAAGFGPTAKYNHGYMGVQLTQSRYRADSSQAGQAPVEQQQVGPGRIKLSQQAVGLTDLTYDANAGLLLEQYLQG